MNGYDLTRNWYNFKFENPSKVRAIHSDLYFYIIDLWNRLGQKKEFGLPTAITMQLMNIGSYNTYKKTLSDLIDFGFIKLIKESKNQHSSKVIALSKIDKATDKALDKANAKATDEPTDKPTDSIIEQRTIEQINNKQTIDERLKSFQKKLEPFIDEYGQKMIKEFYLYWTEKSENSKKMRFEKENVFDVKRRLIRWSSNNFNSNKTITQNEQPHLPIADPKAIAAKYGKPNATS